MRLDLWVLWELDCVNLAWKGLGCKRRLRKWVKGVLTTNTVRFIVPQLIGGCKTNTSKLGNKKILKVLFRKTLNKNRMVLIEMTHCNLSNDKTTDLYTEYERVKVSLSCPSGVSQFRSVESESQSVSLFLSEIGTNFTLNGVEMTCPLSLLKKISVTWIA